MRDCNVGLRINNIFREDELDEDSVVKKSLTTAIDKSWNQQKEIRIAQNN